MPSATPDDLAMFDQHDDLFSEFHTPNPPHQGQAPSSDQWSTRLEDLITGRCSQKIAWSEVGTIASIDSEAASVNVQVYTQAADGSFGLSPATSIDVSFHQGAEIVHVQFSQQGLELAVVDKLGQISIHNAGQGVNRMIRTAARDSASLSPNDAVIAMKWQAADCPVSQPIATRSTGSWRLSPVGKSTIYGPSNPHPTSSANAIYFLTRHGTLSMMYTVPYPTGESRYEQINHVLEGHTSSDANLAHASLGFEHGSQNILLTTCGLGGAVKVYSITVQWGYPKINKRELLPQGFRPKPRFEVHNLCSFQMSTQDKYGSPRQVIGLNVLAAIQDTITNRSANRTILAVLANEADALGSSKTSVVRYELSYEDEEVHPAFTQISPSTNVSTTSSALEPMRKEDLQVDQVITSCQILFHGTVIAFTRVDGAVDFFCRFSMNHVLPHDVNDFQEHEAKLRTPLNVGFGFVAQNSRVVHCALSPNSCCIAYAQADGSGSVTTRLLTWPGNEDPFSTSHTANEVTKLESTAVALSLLLTNTSHIHDASDVVALANSLSRKLPQQTVGDLHRLTVDNIWSILPPQHFPTPPPPEGPKEQKQQMLELLHKWALSTPIQRALTTQMSFSRGQPASVTYQNAWLLLSLRHTLWLSMMAANVPNSETGSSDVPITLVAVVEWFLDFLSEMLDELVRVSGQANARRTMDEVAGIFMSSQTSWLLPVLLTSLGRLYLEYILRYVRTLVRNGEVVIATTTHPSIVNWRVLLQGIAARKLDSHRFESFCHSISTHLKYAYTNARYSDSARHEAERAMLITGLIPEILKPVVVRILTNEVDKLLIDEPGDGRSGRSLGCRRRATASFSTSKGWDVIYRLPILDHEQSVTTCTRCGSVTMNLRVQRPPWLLHILKLCVCGNQWMVLEDH